MLDFYLIDDEQARPDDPEQAALMMAGGLNDHTFGRLKRKQVIDERFEYCKDFRWSRSMLIQIRSTIMKRGLQADTDVQKLLLLLDLAERHGNGLISYTD